MSGYSSRTIKKIDDHTIKVIGIPSMVLMERAALAVSEKLQENEAAQETSYAIVCGTGNNGGDGLAVGRLLHQAGKEVTLYLVGDSQRASEEFNMQLNIVKNLGLTIKKYHTEMGAFKEDVILDALFGIGLNRDVEPPHKQAIESINNSSGRIIALDVPSGLSADSGEKLGSSVEAEQTYTIGFMKKGFENKDAGVYTGEVTILTIGYPEIHFFENIIAEEQNNDKSI